MANTQLDTLTITLNAEVGNAKKNLNGVATSLQKLEEVGKNADWKVFDKIKKHLQGIANIDFTNVASSLRDVVSALKATGLSTRKEIMAQLTAPKVDLGSETSNDREPNFEMINLQLPVALGYFDKIDDKVEKMVSSVENLGKKWDMSSVIITSSVRSMGVDFGDLGKDFIKTDVNFTKLIKKIGNIALYRTIRRAIQLIVGAIKTGIQNIAQVDSIANKTMSNITSSFDLIKNSLGVAIMPLLQALEPTIMAISNAIANLNNSLGKTFAVLMGNKTFQQATLYVKDYAKALKNVSNLGIDELNVVSDNSAYSMFTEEEVSGTFLDGLKSIGAELAIILALTTAIASFIVLFKGGSFITALTTVGTALGIILGGLTAIVGTVGILINGFDWAGFVATLGGIAILITALTIKFGAVGATIGAIIASLALLAISIKEVVSAWDDMGTWQRIIGVLGLVLGLIGAIFTAIGIATVNPAMIAGGAIALITGVGSAIAVSETAKNGITFAQGGFPEDGLFFANHNELVGQFSNGKTAVANNEQITEGIYQAVLQAMQDSGSGAGYGGDVVLQLDGREIARTTKKYNNQDGASIFAGGTKYEY